MSSEKIFAASRRVAPAILLLIFPAATLALTILLLCSAGLSAQAWKPSIEPSVPASYPAAMLAQNCTWRTPHDCHFQNLHAGGDGYLYVSVELNGTWRASQHNLLLHQASPVASDWTEIDGYPGSGWPSNPYHSCCSNSPIYVYTTGEDATNLYFMLGGEDALGSNCRNCQIVVWNKSSSTITHITSGLIPNSGWTGFAHDASGNIYALAHNPMNTGGTGQLLKSTNSGLSWTSVVDSVATLCGTGGSAAMGFLQIFNGAFYTGGDSGGTVANQSYRIALDGSTCTVVVPATEPSGGNGSATQMGSDATANTIGTYLLAFGANSGGYPLRRCHFDGTSCVIPTGLVQFCSSDRNSLRRGTAANEWFLSCTHNLTNGGVLHSTDGGATWSQYGFVLNDVSQGGLTSGSAFFLTVSPIDNSQYLYTDIKTLWVDGSPRGGTRTLSAISVTPNPASVTVGGTREMTATCEWSDGSTSTCTSTSSWSSSNTAVATVTSAGLVTGRAAGSAAIKASQSSISGSANLTVTSTTTTNPK